jgi:hypothetical protein
MSCFASGSIDSFNLPISAFLDYVDNCRSCINALNRNRQPVCSTDKLRHALTRSVGRAKWYLAGNPRRSSMAPIIDETGH